jgi:pyruvate dehydrogenase E2 component (dihydrolipoamide acetyltransferase)
MPDVFMPRLSDTMTEGAIAQWLKAEGDRIERGDVLAEIETDKAVMDLEAYEAGVLQKILVQPGETVPIGAPIAVIGDGSGDGAPSAADAAGGSGATAGDGAGPAPEDSAAPGAATPAAPDAEDSAAPSAATPAAPAPAAPSPQTGQPGAQGAQAPAPEHVGAATEAGPSPAGAPSDGGPLKASPVVRALARTHGIDLSTVAGTGPGGRIIRADVEELLARPGGAGGPAGASPEAPSSQAPSQPAPSPQPAAPTAPVGTAGADDERIPLTTIRKVTARRLSEAAMVPVFQLTTILDATRLVELRADINSRLAASGIKVSVTDLLVRGCAVALRSHPEVNASFGGDAIIRHRRVNVGIAVALEDGLIVPVVKDADRKSVSEIGSEAKELATRARAGKLTPDEFSGGTFTISNLGMYGIDTFIAVLNPPEAAILAVGATADEPVVIDGEVQVRKRMRLTLTVDHRVLDGATAAAFLRDLTDLLAEPLRILV